MATASQSAAPRLHFVVSTDVEKQTPELRKFIRSHCMIGKNRGKTLPHRKKKPKGTLDDASLLRESIEGSSTMATTTTTSHHAPLATVPRKLGSELSSIQFASAVEPEVVEVVLRFSFIAKKLLFALEPCIFFERRAEAWIAPLAFDPAYLHSMIFSSQYYFDAVLPRSFSLINQRSLPHYLETVKLLRERLAHGSDSAKLSFTTMAAVMALAAHALWTGNHAFARYHVEGLRKIVNLRGGVDTFKVHPKLLMEIFRCDIGIALESGSRCSFFSSPSSNEPYPAFPNLKSLLELQGPATAHSPYELRLIVDDMADELSRIWEVMSEFCSLINFAADSEQRISEVTLLEAVSSVMYRLMGMKFDVGTSNEAIRLGLLAFSCSVFLQWQRLGLSFPPLISAFRDCLATIDSLQMAPRLVLWLFTIGATVLFDTGDEWWLKPALLVKMGKCEIRSWGEMRHLLKSNLWIDLIHDSPGKLMFNSTVIYLDSPSSSE
ncbi:hypothetical protein V495_08731 [Pseudogymnoascus sp. VKM F-4514 (FW-929)]|nr:hypothetical protein V495_08731 [Pseudogymnoascus sp. VKM F-4514 (FW-929)]KFY59881.1 hypothetical protein V497_04035 [Pseudogymnoascus sp. VKM F-4516 (FW-969)]